MKSVGKSGTWMMVQGCGAVSVFWQTDHVISRLNLPVQNVLKFHDLISVVIEETTNIHQAEKQFREIILKSDCPFLTSLLSGADPFSVCLAVRSHVLIKQLLQDPVAPKTPILSWVTSSSTKPPKLSSPVLLPNL